MSINFCADQIAKLITEHKWETGSVVAFVSGMTPELMDIKTADLILTYGIKLFQLLAFASTVVLTIYTIYKKEKNSRKEKK